MEHGLNDLETNDPHGSRDQSEDDFMKKSDDEDEKEELSLDYEESDRELANKLQSEEMNYRGGRKSERLQSKTTFCLKKHESAIVKSVRGIFARNLFMISISVFGTS